MRKLMQEFKGFALKGNMIDLAVAVVIGAAFGAVVNSLVKHIFMPLISYVVPSQGGYQTWMIGRIAVGAFIAEVVNFLVVAMAVFLVIVKVLGTLVKKAAPPPAPEQPTTMECPLCLSMIPIKARRCAHCAADLEPVASSAR